MTFSPHPPAVVVMARWWAEGAVKTRLAASIGQEAAREVYRMLVEGVWAGLSHPELERHLHFTPAHQAEAMSQWLPEADLIAAQPDDDLGQRMMAALRTAAEVERPWVAVVGTDAPQVTAEFLLENAQHLEHADVVMTPTLDGGYALLIMKAVHAQLFSDMTWSTNVVAAQTRKRAAATGLVLVETKQVRDLDEFADLEALQQQGYFAKD